MASRNPNDGDQGAEAATDRRRRAGTPSRTGSARILDVVISLATIFVLSPLLVGRALFALAAQRKLFDLQARVGRFEEPFSRLRFAGAFPLGGSAVWFNLLRGDMALVGPRALAPEEAALVPENRRARFDVPPGLVSPYGVRSQVGIAHADEFEVDAEYAARASNREALGLLLRAMLGRLLGGNDETLERPAEVSIFGIPMINTSMDAAVEWILEVSEPGQSARQVAFVNPDCLNIAWRNPGYKRVLCSADRVFPDGIGIRIGGRMLGWGLRDNVNGTDLFPLLCESATAAGRALYLLGARPGVAAGAAASMQQRFPRLRIAGCRDGYFSPDEEPDVVAEINASGAAILLVALGAPRQELWIAERLAGLQVPVAMGVGGLFDFYSGRIRRAPIWMREIGLEWVYRIMQEPGRMWRRYIIGNPVFLYRVWIQKRHPERFEASDESQPS